jgi:hypothetical protein
MTPVEEYGAVPAQAGDSTEALQEALDAASSLLLTGEYRVEGTLEVHGPVTLVGRTRQVSGLLHRPLAGDPRPLFRMPAGRYRDLELRRLRLYGNGERPGCDGLDATSVRLRMIDCRVAGFAGAGVRLRGAIDSVIDHCSIGHSGAAVVLDDGPYPTTTTRLLSCKFGAASVILRHFGDAVLRDCGFEDIRGDAIEITPTWNHGVPTVVLDTLRFEAVKGQPWIVRGQVHLDVRTPIGVGHGGTT